MLRINVTLLQNPTQKECQILKFCLVLPWCYLSDTGIIWTLCIVSLHQHGKLWPVFSIWLHTYPHHKIDSVTENACPVYLITTPKRHLISPGNKKLNAHSGEWLAMTCFILCVVFKKPALAWINWMNQENINTPSYHTWECLTIVWSLDNIIYIWKTVIILKKRGPDHVTRRESWWKRTQCMQCPSSKCHTSYNRVSLYWACFIWVCLWVNEPIWSVISLIVCFVISRLTI